LSNQANSFAEFAEGGQVMSDVNMETITPKGMEDVNVATEEQIPSSRSNRTTTSSIKL
jgi:hypothetical protein